MGKGKKSQNDAEVLGQIFDFIFKEAKKAPDKRRPIKLKPTGISTSHELVDGLAAALEQPGMLITDQALASMNSALTVEFGRLKANEDGSNAAKFTTTSLIDFVSDPNKFLSKPKDASKLAMRDVMKAAFLGRVQQGLVANAWAKKYNLDLDARKAIMGHYQADSIGREAEAGRAFATAASAIASGGGDDSRKNYVASRSADLVGREMFGRNGWEAMSEERKIGLQKALIRGDKSVKEYLADTYRDPVSAKWATKAYGRYTTLNKEFSTDAMKDRGANAKGGMDLFNVDNYNFLETRNLTGRMKEMESYLKMHPSLSPAEQARIQEGIQQLGQAAVVVSGSHLDLADVMVAKRELNQRISDYKSELQLARKTGDKDKIRYYNSQIKNLKQGDRQLNGMRFWGTVGKYEGIAGSLKDVFGEGLAPNAISSILDGSFYDKDRNSFHLPNDSKGVVFGSYSWKLKDENGKEYTQTNKEEIKIFVAHKRDLDKLTGSQKAWAKAMNRYDALLTDVYYLTPKSIMKTLFVNGEAFIHSTYKRASKLSEKLKTTIDFDKIMQGDAAYMKSLEALGVNPYQILRLKASSRLGKIFSFGQRQRDKVNAWMNDHVYKVIRQKIYNGLVKRIVDKEAKALLEKWLVKGGFQVIGKALAITILNAIGIAATGGLGAFLMPIISSIVVDVLYASAKVLIQFLLIVVAGVLGLVWYGIDKGKSNFDAQAYAYTNVVPGEVISNPNFQDIPDINYPGDPGSPTTIYTGDIEEIFNQVRDEMGLHTTLTLVTCTDGPDANEGACNQIDWAWCYSGASVYCKLDALQNASDQVLSNLFRHELMHQIQAGGGTLVREWGADFVSSNGGGYRFNTPDGVKRATETKGALLSRGCTEQQLNEIAFGRGLSGACFNAWKSYILGFGSR